MTKAEAKRNWFQSAVHDLFAVVLGITPPAPGQELFYAAVLLGLLAAVALGGYFAVRMLISQMLG